MFHKGLDRAQILQRARELIEKDGVEKFSMHRLAESLGVKTASLYTHVESMDSLFTQTGLAALAQQREDQLAAIRGKRRDEAVRSLAEAYRRFAREHRELYRFIMKMPLSEDDALRQGAAMVTEPAMQVLEDYALTPEQKMHWQRVLRGLMHGFVSQEDNGYFSHYPVDVEQSYAIAVRCLIEGLHAEEANAHEKP